MKLRGFQKTHSKIVQKQLQMNMINKISKGRYISPEENTENY